MKILVCGCIHGRYDTVVELISNNKPDICILLGDLQTFDDENGMESSCLMKKYKEMGKYKEVML